MKKLPLMTACATLLATFALTSNAQAGATFLFDANKNYYSVTDSPFHSYAGSSLILEDFETGQLSVSNVKAVNGRVKGPGNNTQSVDADTGALNGSGQGGHSYTSGNKKQITFRFTNRNSVGLPTMAGLVWTGGKPDAWVTFRAWDQNNELLGRIRVKLGDLATAGTTHDDRFFGVINEDGISRIRITSNKANFQIDHLQFSYMPAGGFSVVPVPPAVAMGLAGLVGVAVLSRRRKPSA